MLFFLACKIPEGGVLVKGIQKGQRNLALTKQGKYFILAIVFILLPAYLLSVSLLFLLGAMFCAILIYNFVLVLWALRGITIKVTRFPECFAGAPARVGVRVGNEKAWLATSYLQFSLSGEGFETAHGLLKSVPAKETMEEAITIKPRSRGWLEIGNCRFSTAYPFGLVRATVTTAIAKKELSIPNPVRRGSSHAQVAEYRHRHYSRPGRGLPVSHRLPTGR